MTEIAEKPMKKTLNLEGHKLGMCWNKIKSDAVSLKNTRAVGICLNSERDILLKHAIDAIRSAEQMICVSSFVLQKTKINIAEELLRAANKGVRVYLLTASENHLSKEQDEMSEFDKKVIPEHVDLLDEFAGRILVRTAEFFHSKFILVDPLSTSATGLMLTANLTERALTENIELGVYLSKEQVRDLFIQFSKGFWEESKHELLRPKVLKSRLKSPFNEYPESLEMKWTIGAETNLKDYLDDLLDRANDMVQISAWTFEDGHPLTDKMIDLARKGIKFTILTRPEEINMPFLNKMKRLGAHIYGMGLTHAKAVLVDGREGLVMTSNFSHRGLDQGYESGIVLNSGQTRKMLEVFQYWIDRMDWQLLENPSIGEVDKKIITWDGAKLTQKNIQTRKKISLDSIKASNMAEYLNPAEPSIKASSGDVVRVFDIHWKVAPPRLPSRTKQVKDEKKESKFPRYRKGKQTYMVVNEMEDIENAMELAKELGSIVVAP